MCSKWRNKTTPKGFEPLRAEPNGFLVHLLNHSDKVSCDLLTPKDVTVRPYAAHLALGRRAKLVGKPVHPLGPTPLAPNAKLPVDFEESTAQKTPISPTDERNSPASQKDAATQRRECAEPVAGRIPHGVAGQTRAFWQARGHTKHGGGQIARRGLLGRWWTRSTVHSSLSC